MSPLKNKRSLYLQFSITSAFLLILLVFGNLRVDFHPNSIIIDGIFGDEFLNPVIHLNTEGQHNYNNIESGVVRASLVNDLNALRIDFHRKELLTKKDFLLIDQLVENETLTSIWRATLPQDNIDSEDIRTLLLFPSDQTAIYRLFSNQIEWTLTHEDGLIIAEKPSSLRTGPSEITIIKTSSIEQKKAQEDLFPGIESVIDINEDPGLIQIKSIRFVHSFGRLGINLPLHVLNAEEINKSFSVVGCEENYLSNLGSLNIYGDKTKGCSLQYADNIHNLSQRINVRVNQYTILLNIAVFVLSIVFFFGLSFLFMRIKNNEQDSEFNLNLTSFITLLFFLLGVIFTFFSIDQFHQTLLWFSLIFFIFSMIIDKKLFRPITDTVFHQNDSRLKKQEYYLLIAILLFGVIALFFRLGSFDFYEDEFQVIDAAASYIKTGQYARWDWINDAPLGPYSRAWPHTFLIAQSFRIFGISEWSARLPSVLFGIGFFIFFFYFARHFTNKQIALLSLISAVLFPWYLRIFRFTRMYALLIPLSLLLAYFLYRWITGESKPNTGIKWVDNLFGNYLNFDYKYLLISIPLFYLNYIIHVNSLIIVLAVFVYVCTLAIIEKQTKFIILSILGLIIGPVVVLGVRLLISAGIINYSYIFMPRFQQFLSTFGMRRFEYFNDLLRHPFGVLAGFALILFMAYIMSATIKDTDHFRKYLYLFVILITSAIFFIFIADRVAWFFYISHITPFSLILIISGFWHLTKIQFKKPAIMSTLLLFVLVFNFIKFVPDLYFGINSNGVFSEAYQVIVENYDYDNEVIFGQYLRTYYLQDLDNVRVVSLQNNQTYPFSQFLEDLELHQQGWITWETKKSYHVADEIVFFVDRNFEKIHGAAIDDTNVEVYYFAWADLENIEDQQ